MTETQASGQGMMVVPDEAPTPLSDVVAVEPQERASEQEGPQEVKPRVSLKRKITSSDLVRAQFEALEIKKENLLLKKEKLKLEIELLKWKLEQK